MACACGISVARKSTGSREALLRHTRGCLRLRLLHDDNFSNKIITIRRRGQRALTDYIAVGLLEPNENIQHLNLPERSSRSLLPPCVLHMCARTV